eukprot:4061875-Prymnesium_polylepis.1
MQRRFVSRSRSASSSARRFSVCSSSSAARSSASISRARSAFVRGGSFVRSQSSTSPIGQVCFRPVRMVSSSSSSV